MITMNTVLRGMLALLAVMLSAPAGEMSPRLTSMFQHHCYECHDTDVDKGALDLTALKWNPEDADNYQQWIKIFDKVSRDEMPPKKRDRPTAETRSDFLAALRGALHDVGLAKQSREGRRIYRRLNRNEYVNTIHDLLNIDIPLHDELPEDGTEGGFDNIGSALDLSAVHLERYLRAADLALQEATVSTAKPTVSKIRTDYTETWHSWNTLGFQNKNWADSPEGLLAIRWNGYNGPHGELGAWSPPVSDARYRFRIRAKAMVDRDGPNAKEKDRSRPDRHITLKIGLATWPRAPGSTVNNTYAEMSHEEFREFTYEARVKKNQTLWLSPYRAVRETPDERPMVDGLCAIIEWIEIEGPLIDQWPPPGHQLLYGDLPLQPTTTKPPHQGLVVVSHAPAADARRLLAGFLPKVFRRPVSDEEIDEHVAFMLEQLNDGRSFDEALRAAYKLALCSPKFLFLHETTGTLDNYALAARLSYGLWSSTPDDELYALADASRLSNPFVLLAQAERMLTSPKARRFTSSFLASWLNLRNIDFTQPDTKLYPEFEDYLQQSMMRESELFFDELLSHDLSVTNVLHSDFAMLNARLAEHYDIAGVRGDHFRKVSLPYGSRRGGFISQGAVLKVSANGTSTSPVVRGAYVLERILGTPPDPPPKGIDVVEPDIRGATTIREQLELHRSQAHCASCHARLDPPGMALENYDATGRWRTNYRYIPESAKNRVVHFPGLDWRYYAQGPVVDSSYELVDGRRFKDIDEYKQLLLNDPEQIARAMTQKLIAHLTGARSQFADREVVDAIVHSARGNRYGLRTLLHGVITSRVFLSK